MLTYEQAHNLLRYDETTGDLYWKADVAKNVKAGMVAGKSRKRDLYKTLNYQKRQHQAHRVVWLMMHGSYPKEFIDHINGDRTDNRLCNLREADRHINAQNVRKPNKGNTSGYLGVSFKRGAYEANLNCGKKTIYLGRYSDPKIAHEAYLEAKRVLHIGCTL
jgi:hypothetical protein